jgi:hypothetical protein
MRRQKSHCSDRAFNQSDDRKWPNFVRAFVMYDRASPFGVAHSRRHGPIAFSLTPSRGGLDRDSGLRKMPEEMRWHVSLTGAPHNISVT